jgi:hypothetical protein
MDGFAEDAFMRELSAQIAAARRSLNALDEAIKYRNRNGIFDHAAHFLNHVAMVSKILKPGGAPNSRSRLRGRALRRQIGIEAHEPALDRRLRNLLEHVDEQIERWASKARTCGLMK